MNNKTTLIFKAEMKDGQISIDLCSNPQVVSYAFRLLNLEIDNRIIAMQSKPKIITSIKDRIFRR